MLASLSPGSRAVRLQQCCHLLPAMPAVSVSWQKLGASNAPAALASPVWGRHRGRAAAAQGEALEGKAVRALGVPARVDDVLPNVICEAVPLALLLAYLLV